MVVVARDGIEPPTPAIEAGDVGHNSPNAGYLFVDEKVVGMRTPMPNANAPVR